MTGRLEGKVALVTGASRGLGKAIATLFASQGAAVALVDLKEHWAQKVADELTAAGGRCLGIGADVSDREAVRAAVARTVERFGRLDILVNNAMWNRYEPIEAIEPETVDKMIGVGISGVVWGIQAAIPAMAGGGSIINIASASAFIGMNHGLVYCGVKAGVCGLTRAASVELGSRRIRVNAIAPSTVATEGVKAILDEAAIEDRTARVPLGRIGEPEDIANTALWLASEEAGFVTGQTIVVDGGMIHAFM